MRSFTTILLVQGPPVAAAWTDEVILAATPATEATARALRPAARVVVERDVSTALGVAIAAARHDQVVVVGAHEEADATLLDALEAWRAVAGGPSAYDVTRVVRYLGRRIDCRDWQERGPVRFFDRRVNGWQIRAADGAILWPGARGQLAGNLHVHAPVTLAALVATIESVTRTTTPDDAGTLAGIVCRPPAAVVRGLASGVGRGRAGFFFAMLDGMYALVREVRAWEVRRAVRTEARST